MDVRIVNPFAGYPVIFTWAQHKAAGYQGGTDYGYPHGLPVTAAADGTVSPMNDGLNGIRLTLADGRSVVYRELLAGSLIASGTRVKLGARIATSGRKNGTIFMAPHIEGWVGGVRVQFEPMIHEPAPVDPTVRTTVAAGANVRPYATTDAAKLIPLKGNLAVKCDGYGHAQTPPGLSSDLWLHHAAGWSHSSGFVNPVTTGLTDMTATALPPVVPAPVDPPADDPPDPPADDPPVSDPPADQPDDPSEPEPTKPASHTAGIITIILAAVALIGGVLAAIFGG